MAYLRPPAFARRVFNPLAMRFRIAGTATLAVRGRATGAVQTVPIIPVTVAGMRYLVSTRGESEWVRNLRHQGACALGGINLTAVEIPPEERPPIISAYRVAAGKTVDRYFEALPDPADHPIFKLTPTA